MKRTGTWKRYVITALIGLVAALLLLLSRGSFAKEIQTERFKDISDAFFVPGVLLVCMGALVFVAENGIFDMLKFGAMKVISMMRSEKSRSEYPKTYYDYLQQQAEKARKGYGFLLICGAAFLLLAVFFAFM